MTTSAPVKVAAGREVELTQENEQFVRDLIERGAFPDRPAAINAAFDLFRGQVGKERDRLVAVLDEALQQLARGEYVALDRDGLRQHCEDTIRRGMERYSQRKQ